MKWLALAALGLLALSKGSKKMRRQRDPSSHYKVLRVRHALANMIVAAAQGAGVPADLALATALVESGLDPDITGDHGDSIGLFQVNTKAHPAAPRRELFTPQVNILWGLRILRAIIEAHGDDAAHDYLAVRLRYTGASSPEARARVTSKWAEPLAAARAFLAPKLPAVREGEESLT